jgi:hypothetical protein
MDEKTKNAIEEIAMKGEVWRQSSLAPAYYVSNYGRIYGTLYHKLIQPETSHGYARIFIKDLATNRFKHYFAHILVATEFCKGKSDGTEVHHKNCNKLDNRACNLMWVTKPVHEYIHSLLDKLGGAAA